MKVLLKLFMFSRIEKIHRYIAGPDFLMLEKKVI